MEWISVKERLPEEGVIVHAMIGNNRVIEPLKRHGRLWFVPDGHMYVYYTPTHWMPIEPPVLKH